MIFRKAQSKDIDKIEAIYDAIHTQEEQGLITTGWIRGVYPVRETAENALKRDDLFVAEQNGEIVASAVINQTQMEEYTEGNWQYNVPEEKICVLHTLTVLPDAGEKGVGKGFVAFYEQYAKENNMPYLRIDTNARNVRARAMYTKLGFKEVGEVPCDFNGIPSVKMVLLEKKV
ncbi:MAG: GNAT family N-acetyltransferase [Clostridia bacterium]|nr:GNAT family N-acetyltransferase [Clostridia bacterium]